MPLRFFSTRPPPQRLPSLCRPLHNPSREPQDLHEPLRIHPGNGISVTERRVQTGKKRHLLHTLTDIPVHESTLGVHEIELVI